MQTLEELKMYKKQKILIARDFGMPEKYVQDAIEEILSMIKDAGGSITVSEMENIIRNNPDSEFYVYVDTNNPEKLQQVISYFSSYFNCVFSRDGKRYEFNIV